MPLLNTLTALPASLGKVTHLLADTGYFSAENVKVCGQQGIEPLIAMKRDVHHQPLFERFAAEPMAPDSEDPVEQMAYRVKTQAGRARYALRKHTVEPVFGIIKHVRIIHRMRDARVCSQHLQVIDVFVVLDAFR